MRVGALRIKHIKVLADVTDERRDEPHRVVQSTADLGISLSQGNLPRMGSNLGNQRSRYSLCNRAMLDYGPRESADPDL